MLYGPIDDETTVRALQAGLGLSRPLPLDAGELAADLDAARQDPAQFDRLSVAVALAMGRRLAHQYPASSLLWDLVLDDLAEVLAQSGFAQPAPGTWTITAGPVEGGRGRAVVVELQERGAAHGDERRFALRWGVALPGVPFCRCPGHHRLTCCAVIGGLGAVREPFGDHCFVLSVGLLAELQGGTPARLVGREGFRARLHRLATFCGALGDADRLADLVAGRPWQQGIGIAEQLRNADPRRLRHLLA